MITALCEAQACQKRYADRQQQEKVFEEGNLVLLSTSHLALLTPSCKLSAKFVGPFSIVKQVSPVAFCLDLPGTMKIHSVFHVSQLQRYEDLAPDHNNPPCFLPLLVDNQMEFEVQEVLQKHF